MSQRNNENIDSDTKPIHWIAGFRVSMAAYSAIETIRIPAAMVEEAIEVARKQGETALRVEHLECALDAKAQLLVQKQKQIADEKKTVIGYLKELREKYNGTLKSS